MANDEWETPQELYDKLNAVFRFKLDAAATAANAKCARFITREENALTVPWRSRVSTGAGIFCNPPYGKAAGPLRRWVRKGVEEGAVLLVRCDTSAKWFSFAFRYSGIVFLQPRVRFCIDGKPRQTDLAGSVLIYPYVYECHKVSVWNWKTEDLLRVLGY